MNTNSSEEKKRPHISRMAVEFLAGTQFEDAIIEMWRLHHETKADIETVFNNLRVVIADNQMFEKFGYRSFRK